jgi:hypothetical protein
MFIIRIPITNPIDRILDLDLAHQRCMIDLTMLTTSTKSLVETVGIVPSLSNNSIVNLLKGVGPAHCLT